MTNIKVDINAPLTMEYLELPIVDLSFRFLYRFKGPLDTVWCEGRIAKFSFDSDFNSNLEQFALNEWNKLVSDSEPLKRSECLLVEMDVIPKVSKNTTNKSMAIGKP